MESQQDRKLIGNSPTSLAAVTQKQRARAAAALDLTPNILVVDDDPIICQQLERLYTHTGYRVRVANGAEQALELLAHEDIDLVVTDIRLPGLSGVELAKRCVEQWSDVPIIVMTGYAGIENAVEVLKLGASDYFVKPFSAAAIQESTRSVLEKASLFTEIRHLRQQLKESCEFGGMLSRTPEMHKVFETIRMVAPTDSSVVVEGETGTGKELVASAIHYQSPRQNGPFITINCGGFPETLLESELFGYERGAFTGADRARPGKIELASTGTLFLDEIENMPLSMQAKLLLVLNDQRVQRLGSSRWTKVDMRIIAASNVPLRSLVAQDKMRRDFFYRINVIPIRLIPLRQRLNDIPLLVQDFLRHHRVALEKQVNKISPRAMAQLMAHDWPGNVRELQNVLEKAIVLTRSRLIEEVELSDPVSGQPAGVSQTPMDLPLPEWIKHQEKQYLMGKLEAAGGRIDLTARFSGVDVRTIHRKMKLYGLDKKVFQQKDLPRN
ncbi:MAG TPA: sigma-54 dependent transcriptional regulator [Candidatus Binatia bacterium]|jgi:two-component system NtrC family response regulator